MQRFCLAMLMAAGFMTAGPVISGTAFAADSVPPLGKDDMVLGSAKAPVTVIEYASLTCPHCGRWENDVFPKVKSDLIDTGKIRYAFRDFPLDGIALKAAQVAHCQPDRFYSFIEVLFESQTSWVPHTANDDPTPELMRIAKLGGLTDAKVKGCLADETMENAIVASRQKATDAGVNSTPTFFFNGKSHAGELPYDEFLKMVQDAGS